MADTADSNQPESRGGDSAVETGTVAAIGSLDAAHPAASEGFAPLDNPPRVDGVELIGAPDPSELTPLDSKVEDPGPEALESEIEPDRGSPPLVAPIIFTISADLIQRAKEIALETERIDVDLARVEEVSGVLGADEATLEQEE